MNIERLPITLVLRRGAAYLLDGALLAGLVVASQLALRAELGANLTPRRQAPHDLIAGPLVVPA